MGASHDQGCADDGGQRSTFSIYARLRRSRLVLARRIASFASAVEFAERLRSERFPDQDVLCIVDEGTGTEVTCDATSSGRWSLQSERPREGAERFRDAVTSLRTMQHQYHAAVDEALATLVSPKEAARHAARRLAFRARDADEELCACLVTVAAGANDS